MTPTYVTLGTNDMAAATAFYDALFANTDFTRLAQTDRMTFWQNGDIAFAIALPFDGKPAGSGNGSMIGFDMGAKDAVDRLYQLAKTLGGSCAGQPSQKGPRYSGYVRDLDQNKLCFFA